MNLVHCAKVNLMLGLMGVIRRHVCGMCGAKTREPSVGMLYVVHKKLIMAQYNNKRELDFPFN
jgi:hypothetical protein